MRGGTGRGERRQSRRGGMRQQHKGVWGVGCVAGRVWEAGRWDKLLKCIHYRKLQILITTNEISVRNQYV